MRSCSEGVARGAWPIRVIATRREQLAGILIPGGRTSRASRLLVFRIGHCSQNTLLEGSAPLASLWPRCADTDYRTLRLAVASTPFSVYRRSHANSRHSTAVYSCRTARLICTVAEPTKWCSPRCPRAPPLAAPGGRSPARAPAPVQLAPALALLLHGHTLSTSVYAICLST